MGVKGWWVTLTPLVIRCTHHPFLSHSSIFLMAFSHRSVPHSDVTPLLRCGITGVEERDKALSGVITGRFPVVRPSLGPCVIRGTQASLWFPVAELFGFDIPYAVFPPGPFRSVMSPLYPSTVFVSRLPRDFSPGMTFCDESTLLPFTHQYWTTSVCPHLVAHSGIAPPSLGSLPSGWVGFTHTISHSQVGGATSGSFSVSLIIRESDWSGASTFPGLPQRPWSVVLHSLSCREPAPALSRPPPTPWDPQQAVLPLSDGSYAAWGQFPVGLSTSPRFTMSSD